MSLIINSVNILQVPTLMANLATNPLPPPPPMPPVNLSELADDELRLLESNERAGLEGFPFFYFILCLTSYSARIRHLQEIRTLMDAAAFKMDQFMSATIPPVSTTTEETTPTESTESTPVETPREEPQIETIVPPVQEVTPPTPVETVETIDNAQINPFERLTTEEANKVKGKIFLKPKGCAANPDDENCQKNYPN